MRSISFRYWNDCVDPEDMEAMWKEPAVKAEWLGVGETMGSKVHLSRDPDGHPYLTQTEMRAVAGIIVRRHFVSQIDSDMICAIAELESERQLLTTSYNKKSDELKVGIMQISQKIAEWLTSELGYRHYQVTGDEKLVYKPFVNLYLAAAYLKWLSFYDRKERTEEFMVRAYNGGTKKATHKSTLAYWKKYLSVQENLPSGIAFGVIPIPNAPPAPAAAAAAAVSQSKVPVNTTWDSRASNEDMEGMWNNPRVNREWTKSGERSGKVRFSHDVEMNPYLSRVELRAVAEIILTRHFRTKDMEPTSICALSEMISMRFVNGVGQCTGLMGIDYPTARWLYNTVGFKGYTVESVDDLTKPFVSMYFGAAYMSWLSEYDGRRRSLEFVVQAYVAGPQNVNVQETSRHLAKFNEILSFYEETEKTYNCTIM